MSRTLRSGVLAVLLVGAPAALGAQAGLFVGGGVVIPSGDFGQYAKNGFGGMGGVNLSFPALPIGVRAEAMYLYNSHEGTDAGSTSLYGAMASATYGIGAGPAGLYLIGGVGYLNHHYGAPSGQPSENEWKFNWGIGAGVNFSRLFGEVRYMQRDRDKFIPIMVGIRFGG